MQVSIYKNYLDNIGAIAPFDGVLRHIRDGRWRQQVGVLRDIDDTDEYNAMKKEVLPGVTFAGVFSPRRSKETCVAYNHMIVLDVDDLEEQPLEDLKDSLRFDPYCLCFFVSPSNVGLKIIVRIDSNKEDHYSAFECLRLYFLNNYKVELDTSGKNIDRLCFMSFDPDLYYNGSAQVFPVEVKEDLRERIYADREVTYKGFGVTTDDRKVYETCKGWADYYTPYEQGARNVNIHKCACNLNRCGMSQENAILCIARDRVDLTVQEIKDTVRKVYASNKKEHNTISVYDFDAEQDKRRGLSSVSTLEEMVEDVIASGTENMVPSGHVQRDKVFGGGRERGCVYASVGREKTYKSIDAIYEACNLAMSGQPTLYLNGEMSKRQFLMVIAQQRLAIPRTQFSDRIYEVLKWVKENLQHLLVITGRNFTHEKIVMWVKSIEDATGKEIVSIYVDGISHMDAQNKKEIEALIANSLILKEVAKDTNAAITVLIHTDASCHHVSRQPQNFIRGKTKVMSNFDGSMGFSRFILPGTENEELTEYQLRQDRYYVWMKDDRMTGEEMGMVMSLDANCCPSETAEGVAFYEIKTEKQSQRR